MTPAATIASTSATVNRRRGRPSAAVVIRAAADLMAPDSLSAERYHACGRLARGMALRAERRSLERTRGVLGGADFPEPGPSAAILWPGFRRRGALSVGQGGRKVEDRMANDADLSCVA